MLQVKGLKLSWTEKNNVVIQNDKEMMKDHMLGLGISENLAEEVADTFSHPKLTIVNLDKKRVRRIRIACVDESRLFEVFREEINDQGDYYVRSTSENNVANGTKTR